MNNWGTCIARLRRMQKDLSALDEILPEDMAQRTCAQAKLLCPVRSGRLRASIISQGGRVSSALPYAGRMDEKTGFLSGAYSLESYRALAQEKMKERMI